MLNHASLSPTLISLQRDLSASPETNMEPNVRGAHTGARSKSVGPGPSPSGSVMLLGPAAVRGDARHLNATMVAVQ